MNLPSALTGVRILLVPVILAIFSFDWPTGRWLASILFAIAAFTDLLDGYVARRLKMTSSFGVFLDLTADKLLVLSILIALVQIDQMSAWMVILVMAREVVISGLRSYAAAIGLVIPAGPWGKLKTVVTFIALVGIIGGVEPFSQWLFYLALALTMYSAVDYIWAAVPVLNGKTGA